MPTVPTFDEIYAAGQSEVQTRNPALSDFREGSNLDAVVGGTGMIADEVMRGNIEQFAAKNLDTAEGGDLDALISDRYPGMEPRYADAAAVVDLTFSRGDASGTIVIPAGTTCRATVNGVSVTFTTDDEAEISAGGSEVTTSATCAETGTGGNVAEATITTIVDEVEDDPSITVTNADRAVGGDVEETDDALRARARRYLATLRRGTVAALEAGAMIAGVHFVTVDESKIDPDEGGYVSVYVGDPDARGNDALAALVDSALVDYRAAGVDVRVVASERDEIEFAVIVYVRKQADSAAIVTNARAAILAYTNALPPSATLYLSRVEAAACSVSPDVLGAKVEGLDDDYTPAKRYQAVRVVSTDLSVSAQEA